ncbi:MAG: hypothetical protein ACRC34_01160 [Cetobacterium sp.]
MNRRFFLVLGLSFFNYLFLRNYPNGDYNVYEIFKSPYLKYWFIFGITSNIWAIFSYKREVKAYKYFNIKDVVEKRGIYSIEWIVVPVILWTLNLIPFINDSIYLVVKGYLITFFYPISVGILKVIVVVGNLYFFIWLSKHRVLEHTLFKLFYYRCEIELDLIGVKILQDSSNRVSKSKNILKWKLAYYLEISIYLKRDCKNKIETICKKLLDLELSSDEIFLIETIFELLKIDYISKNRICDLTESFQKSKNQKNDEYFIKIQEYKKTKEIPYIVRKYIIYKDRGYDEYCKNFLSEILKVDIEIFNKNYKDIDKRVYQALIKFFNISINREKNE